MKHWSGQKLGSFKEAVHTPTGSGWGRSAVGDHVHPLERDEAITDHLIQRRQKATDLLLGVHHFDDEREVLGKSKDSGGVEMTLGSEPLDGP